MADYLGLGDRLTAGPSTTLAAAAFGDELRAARYLWSGMSAADLAHTIALHECEAISTPIARQLLDALLELDADTVDDVELDPAVGDVYNNRDRLLTSRVGDVVGHLHAGRARREASTLGWLLWCRRALVGLGVEVCGLVDDLARVADEHVDTVMPDFTYLHRAHPTSLGHYLLSHAWPFARHLDRLRTLLETLAVSSPAGSGSTNGSRIPLDRRLLAELLGFAAPMWHTRDSMWAPDLAIDMANLCVQITTSIDRLAEELQLWTTEAFGLVQLADEHCRTSVIMPHKKNPYALTHLRGAARRITGLYVGVATSNQTASGQPDNRTIAYHDVPFMLGVSSDAARLVAEVIARADFARDALAAAAADPLMASTEICDLLTLEFDVDNRTAHRIVGRAVRAALDDGEHTITAERLDKAASEYGVGLDVDDERLQATAVPGAIVADRQTFGGAGATSVHEMCSSLRSAAADTRGWLDRRSDHTFRTRLVAIAADPDIRIADLERNNS